MPVLLATSGFIEHEYTKGDNKTKIHNLLVNSGKNLLLEKREWTELHKSSLQLHGGAMGKAIKYSYYNLFCHFQRLGKKKKKKED